MWAKQLQGHRFALRDLWAGPGEAGAAEADSGTLGYSGGHLPNLGHVKVPGERMGGGKCQGECICQPEAKREAEKARNSR